MLSGSFLGEGGGVLLSFTHTWHLQKDSDHSIGLPGLPGVGVRAK